jgi:hypothetical protein
MKEAALEEKISLLEKEIRILGEDSDKARLDLEEAVDALKLEIESLKMVLKESIPDFRDKFQSVRKTVLRDIDPEWMNRKQS